MEIKELNSEESNSLGNLELAMELDMKRTRFIIDKQKEFGEIKKREWEFWPKENSHYLFTLRFGSFIAVTQIGEMEYRVNISIHSEKPIFIGSIQGSLEEAKKFALNVYEQAFFMNGLLEEEYNEMKKEIQFKK